MLGLLVVADLLQRQSNKQYVPFCRCFGYDEAYVDLIVNISGKQQVIINRKMALQTTVIPIHTHTLNMANLIHKRRKIGSIHPKSTFSGTR